MRIWMVCETLTEVCVPNVTVLEIRENLKRMNHEVLLFCPSTEKKYVTSEQTGIYFVPSLSMRGVREAVYQFLLGPCMFWACRRSRPDWVYCRPVFTMFSPVLVARIIGIPHIVHFSGDAVEILRSTKANILIRYLYSFLERVNVKLSTRVIVETSNSKTIREIRHGIRDQRVVVIPNGANVELFKPMDKSRARERIGIARDYCCVAFAGNVGRLQGLSYLVESAPLVLRELPKTLFLIVGDGDMKDQIQRQVDQMGLASSFVFTGRVPYQEVPVYIGASDVCVAPRIRDVCEKTGISLLKLGEYLACERPVVASDIDGVGPVLREANAGIPVPLEDPGELARAVLRLLKDPTLRDDMGRNGRRYVVENLSWQITTVKLLEAYRTAVAKKGK